MLRIAKIIVGALAGGLLFLGGAMATEANLAIDKATSTFTKSTFDYVVVSPSNEQLETFTANKLAVDSIFPVYHYENTLKGNASAKINLLLSDKMANYDISFFNPRRIIAGEFKGDGLLLDEVAARKLAVGVGDTVSFPLGGGNFKFQVAAIYAEVKYVTLSYGIAMTTYTPTMKASFAKPANSYQLAFIASKNKSVCAEMLEGYLPYGLLASYEEFKEVQDASRPAGTYTDEEWETLVQGSYAHYKETWEAQPHLNSVQDKETFMQGADDAVATKREGSFQLTMLFAIITPLALGGAYVGFDFLGRKGDEEAKTAGALKANLRKGLIINEGISTGVGLGIAMAGVGIYGAAKGAFFASTFLLYSLPILGALIISIPLAIVYSNLVYGKE